jgi:two-component system NtrC family sensor kinase
LIGGAAAAPCGCGPPCPKSQIKAGEPGVAYVLDVEGRVIAHSDMFVPGFDAQGRGFFHFDVGMFQRDFSGLAQVQAARAAAYSAAVQVAHDIHGREVLTAYAPVPRLGWLVFVERPTDEAYAPFIGK